MSDFLTTHAVTARIEEIIAKATERIVLISPYLRFSQILYERLLEADRRNVQIVFVYGKEELKDVEREKLYRIGNISIYYCHNLHAKCYFNEDTLVISSLNLHESSQNSNREMGVACRRWSDLYKDAVREAQSIIEASRLKKGQAVDLVKRPEPKLRQAETRVGYCIRCESTIPLAPTAPFCEKCYSVWVRFGNPFWEEKVCHWCGRPAKTSRHSPLCPDCVNKPHV